MPAYPWLEQRSLSFDVVTARMQALRTTGVPYTDKDIDDGPAAARRQAETIAEGLREFDVDCAPEKEIIAMIAYLQRLGTDIRDRKEAAE